MLKKFYVSEQTAGFAQEGIKEETEDHDIPTWKSQQMAVTSELCGKQLMKEQKEQLQQVLHNYQDIFKDSPGHTKLAEHKIPTGDARPVRLPPYRIPHTFPDSVKTGDAGSRIDLAFEQ